MNKLVKPSLFGLLILILVFGLYAYKIHALAIESNKLFEYRCLKVNPLLTRNKNSYLKVGDMLNNLNKFTPDELTKFIESYVLDLSTYEKEENNWLAMQQQYMNRWDFKLFEPWYMKQAEEYQTKMYEAYRDNAKYILMEVGQGQLNVSSDIIAKQTEARNRRDTYSKRYDDFVKKAFAINDFRKVFGRVSTPSGCSDRNLIIPDNSATPSANPADIYFGPMG